MKQSKILWLWFVFLNRLQRYQTLTLSKGNNSLRKRQTPSKGWDRFGEEPKGHCSTLPPAFTLSYDTVQDQDYFRHHLGGKENKWFLYTQRRGSKLDSVWQWNRRTKDRSITWNQGEKGESLGPKSLYLKVWFLPSFFFQWLPQFLISPDCL